MRENNILVSKTLAEVGRHIKAGVSTKELGSCSRGVYPLEWSRACVSWVIKVSRRRFVFRLMSRLCMESLMRDVSSRMGDIVSVDCGTYIKGFVGDSAYTFAVGEVER